MNCPARCACCYIFPVVIISVLSGNALDAQLLHSFESNLEGWEDAITGDNGEDILFPSDIGVTHGTQSLAIMFDDFPMPFHWSAQRTYGGGSTEFAIFSKAADRPGDFTFEYDVTFEVDSLDGFSFFQKYIALNSDSGWSQVGPLAEQDTAIDETIHVVIPLADLDPSLAVNSSFYQINIGHHHDTTEGLYYIDNIRLVDATVPDTAADFNKDGVVNDADIDLLAAEVVNNTNNSEFDLTGNNLVNSEDRDQLIQGELATLYGDADLNGSVQFADFNALANGFGGPGGWATGDFNGNLFVQFVDFNILANNFGMSAPAAIPEPTTASLFWLGIVVGLVFGRRNG